jgi:hypothetical protein
MLDKVTIDRSYSRDDVDQGLRLFHLFLTLESKSDREQVIEIVESFVRLLGDRSIPGVRPL